MSAEFIQNDLMKFLAEKVGIRNEVGEKTAAESYQEVIHYLNYYKSKWQSKAVLKNVQVSTDGMTFKDWPLKDQSDDGWVEHDMGMERPIDRYIHIEVEYGNGEKDRGLAGVFIWSDWIKKYRIVKPADSFNAEESLQKIANHPSIPTLPERAHKLVFGSKPTRQPIALLDIVIVADHANETMIENPTDLKINELITRSNEHETGLDVAHARLDMLEGKVWN